MPPASSAALPQGLPAQRLIPLYSAMLLRGDRSSGIRPPEPWLPVLVFARPLRVLHFCCATSLPTQIGSELVETDQGHILMVELILIAEGKDQVGLQHRISETVAGDPFRIRNRSFDPLEPIQGGTKRRICVGNVSGPVATEVVPARLGEMIPYARGLGPRNRDVPSVVNTARRLLPYSTIPRPIREVLDRMQSVPRTIDSAFLPVDIAPLRPYKQGRQ
jgi:hypothetical protein